MTKKIFFLAIIIMAISLTSSTGEFMVGGISSDESTPEENASLQKEAIPKLDQDIRTKVASLMSSSSGEGGNGKENPLKDAEITVLSYKTQVVAGTNYFVKARIGKFIFHLRIYRDLQDNYELSDVKGPVKESDPIEYF